MPSPIPWLDTVLVVWFALTALSVAYVAWDASTRNPELKVMKWGWVLVTLYGGPFMAAAYALSCQKPPNEGHKEFTQPLWKQAFGSTVHCMAGDGTGVIVAAGVTATLGLPMWFDVTAEYVFGFGFALFIFQALFARKMLGGSYVQAVRKTFVPEFISMNAVMAGMIPTMVILMTRDMASMQIDSLRFWAVMSLATMVGFVMAYPVNLWLVGMGMKRGMGTVRVLGEGGTPVENPAATQGAAPGAGMDDMETDSKATVAQIVAMMVLTLTALAAGLVVATIWGRWTM